EREGVVAVEIAIGRVGQPRRDAGERAVRRGGDHSVRQVVAVVVRGGQVDNERLVLVGGYRLPVGDGNSVAGGDHDVQRVAPLAVVVVADADSERVGPGRAVAVSEGEGLVGGQCQRFRTTTGAI